MYRSKRLRLLSLLFSFLLLFGSFGIVSNAADSDEAGGLVSSDLTYWMLSEDTSIDKWNGYYGLRIDESDINNFYIGYALDKTLIKSGDSYSLTFKIPSYDSIKLRYGGTADGYYSQLDNGEFYVGLAYLDSTGSPMFYEGYSQKLTLTDFKNYADQEYTYTFTVDKISGSPYICFFYAGSSQLNKIVIYIGPPSFVNNTEASEDGFIQKIINFFETKFLEVKDKFDNIANLFDEAIDYVGDWFSDLWNNVKNAFADTDENITNNFTETNTSLGGWFADVGVWFLSLGDRISDKFTEIGNSITSKFEEIGNKFTEFFDKFKPRVYETFDWEQGYVDPSNGKIYTDYYEDDYFYNRGYGYTIITDYFEVPSGIKYLLDFTYFKNAYMRVVKYDLNSNFISAETLTYNHDTVAYELQDGYKYIFLISFGSDYPSDDDMDDLCNSLVLVYADEGWINALVHKLESIIKGLFIPNETFIDNWKNSLEQLLADHLGVVYDVTSFLSDFISEIFELLSNSSDYDIDFKLPALEFELNDELYTLWEETSVDMSFMNEGIFKTLYGLYKVMLYLILIFGLFKYAEATSGRTMNN